MSRLPNMLPLYDFKHPRFPHTRGEARTSFDIPDKIVGGACRDRTDDLKLAKLPLSQLS